MRVEIVADECDPLGIRKPWCVHQRTNLLRPIYGGAAARHLNVSPVAQRLDKYPKRASALTRLFVIDDLATPGPRATVIRWRRTYQNAFQARMDWCIQPPGKANHAPVAVCNGDDGAGVLRIDAEPGRTVRLSTAGSRDPDDDELNFRWWVDPEPSSRPGEVTIRGDRKPQAVVEVPDEARDRTIHVILEVTDARQPPLTAYRRVILDCTGGG